MSSKGSGLAPVDLRPQVALSKTWSIERWTESLIKPQMLRPHLDEPNGSTCVMVKHMDRWIRVPFGQLPNSAFSAQTTSCSERAMLAGCRPASSAVPSDSLLAIQNGTNKANGLGVTLDSTVNAKLYYNTPTNFDGLPANMKLYVSGVQVASVTFTSPYAGRPFVFERVVAGVSTLYSGSIVEGRVDLSAVTPSVVTGIVAQSGDSGVKLSWVVPTSPVTCPHE